MLDRASNKWEKAGSPGAREEDSAPARDENHEEQHLEARLPACQKYRKYANHHCNENKLVNSRHRHITNGPTNCVMKLAGSDILHL